MPSRVSGLLHEQYLIGLPAPLPPESGTQVLPCAKHVLPAQEALHVHAYVVLWAYSSASL